MTTRESLLKPRAAGADTAWRPNILKLSIARTVIEVKQFTRDRRSAVFTFLFPVMLLVLFGGIIHFTIKGPGGQVVSFRQYFIAGIVAAGIISTTFNNLATWISLEQHEGLLKRLSATPLPRAAYFAGKIGMATTVTAAQVIIMLAVGVAFYGLRLPTDPGRIAAFFGITVLGVASCSLMGIAITRFIPNARSAPAIIMPPYLILEFISGIFFQFTDVPKWMQAIANVFPMRWMALGYRYVFLPDWFKSQETGHSWQIETVFVVLALWLVGAFVFAVRWFRWDRGIDQ